MQRNVLRNALTPKHTKPAQDEWGLFDPQQAGIPATMRALIGAQEEVQEEPLFETPALSPDTQQPAVNDGGATYAVESPLRCPHCQVAIRTFRALRVVRTQVPFMSTLPRKGYVLVCPECAGVLSAELSGLI